jgi:hypothetical protein
MMLYIKGRESFQQFSLLAEEKRQLNRIFFEQHSNCCTYLVYKHSYFINLRSKALFCFPSGNSKSFYSQNTNQFDRIYKKFLILT